MGWAPVGAFPGLSTKLQIPEKKGTLVLKQLEIGWPFLKKRQIWRNTLKCFRTYVPLIVPFGQARGTSISSAKSAEAPSYAQGSRLPKNLFGEQVGGLSFSHSSTAKAIVLCVGG
jgi:hypothetical protein